MKFTKFAFEILPKTLSIVFATTVLTSGAFSQGFTCSTATPISGVGAYAQQSSLGSPSAFGLGTPCNPAALNLDFVGYYNWACLQSGQYRFTLESNDPDRRLMAYVGDGCSAICFGEGTPGVNANGFTSTIEIPGLSNGSRVLFQVANTSGLPGSGVGGVGVFRVERGLCGGALFVDDVLEPNNTCQTAVVLMQGLTTGLTIHNGDQDFYKVIIPPLQEMRADLLVSVGNLSGRGHDVACNATDTFAGHALFKNTSMQSIEFVFEAVPNLPAGVPCANYDIDVQFSQLDCVPLSGVDDSFENNDNQLSPATLTSGVYTDLWVSSVDPDYYVVDVPFGYKLVGTVLGPVNDLRLTVWSESDQFVLREGHRFYASNASLGADRVFISALTPVCEVYSLVIDVSPDDCLTSGPDVMDLASNFTNISNGFYPSLYVNSWEAHRICSPPGSTVQVDITHLGSTGSINSSLGCQMGDCPGITTVDFASGQTPNLQWTNTTGSIYNLTVFIEYTGSASTCTTYEMAVSGTGDCGSDVVTETFCDPADVNSAGLSTRLMAHRNRFSGQLQLQSSQGPVGEFGYILVGTASAAPGVPVSLGHLCLDSQGGNQTGRFNIIATAQSSVGAFDSQGRFRNAVGTSVGGFGFLVPGSTPWGAPLNPGTTFYFQLWHRDGAGASNFSNGLEVNF